MSRKTTRSRVWEVLHILVVADTRHSKTFWTEVLGAEVFREYEESSVVLRFSGSWALLVTAGGPTPDKPLITSPHQRNWTE